ncbi:MAG: lipid A export permease/ATP-binding protein MsbA [Proteobacteria bacterium]|nr:lipid A export permease/ATP-binding protein MsbA [Pseudomonadota bacterium]MBU1714460.1 lipid A export permease/ATP-binding protein MsbA [Pseudomonadota bacterium]
MSEKEILKRIYQLVKPYRTAMLLAMLCMVLVAGFSAAQAYMVKPLLDKIFFEQDKYLLNLLPLALVAIFLAKGFFYYGYTVLLQKVGQSVIKDLRNKVYSHIQSLPISFFHKTPTGELISRIISDVTLLQGAVSQALVVVLKDSFQVIALLGVVFYQNWQLASMSILFLPVACVPIIIFGRIHRKLSNNNQQTVAAVSNVMHETIAGNRIVKAFCMEDYESSRFAKVVQKLYDLIISDTKVKSFSHSLMELLGGTFVAFILWYGGSEVLDGHSTPGTFFSFLTALVMIYEPIKGISSVNSMIQQGLAASIRVFTVLDTKPEITDKPGAIDLTPMQNELELRNVSFTYDNKVQVLDRIQLTIKKGEALAIVGTSGAGKTSMVNLVPRFFEVTKGQVLLDGHDVRDVTLKSLRSQIAMVTQQTILFNDTIRNNIAYGDLNCTEEEIIEAARAAHALDFINEQAAGFDTVIGESGAKLSGGQRQRLSIARALLKNAPILILDEATSSLDTESEREVQKALENLMKNRTTLVIAHRLSTIRKADRIIVMQNGRIVEEGNHDDLLAAHGIYRMLHNMQH